MKIGLYGGTFDPIHMGHLLLTEWIREELKLDRIVFIPAFIPPHKMSLRITSAQLRFEMVKIAIEKNSHFEVSDFEIKKKDVSYTINTIQYFRRRYQLSKDAIFFLIGSDSLLDFHHWHKPDELLELSTIVVYQRNDVDYNEAKTEILERVVLVDNPIIDVSSSIIRERMNQGISIKYMVIPEVENFISDKNLYKNIS